MTFAIQVALIHKHTMDFASRFAGRVILYDHSIETEGAEHLAPKP